MHSLGWARDALYLFLGFLFLCHIISVTRGTHENGLRAHQTRGVSGLVVVAHTHVSSVFLLRPSRTARTRSYFGRHGASRSVPFLSKKAIYFRILFMLLFRHSLRPRFYITLISPWETRRVLACFSLFSAASFSRQGRNLRTSPNTLDV